MKQSADALRILLSAYFFAPGAGSEMGTGWNAALELARAHQVWVVTPGHARDRIERALAAAGRPHLGVVYHDLPRFIVRSLSTNEVTHHVRYYLWQLAIFPLVSRLHREIGFDVTHHLTPQKYWAPSSLAWLDAPFVWGPVGAAGGVRPALWRGVGLRGQALDAARSLGQAAARLDPAIRATARRSALALAADDHTARRCRKLGAQKVVALPAIALPEHELARLLSHPVAPPSRPFVFASFQRLVYWKGVHLGLEAFARLDDPRTIYHIIGDGPEKPRLMAMAQKLGVADRVRFQGNVGREDYFASLLQADAVVYPSLHAVSAWTVVEAMAGGKPVICLTDAGDAVPVTASSGVIVRGASEREIVAGLAEAMATLVARPELCARLGEQGRSVARSFGWSDRARALDRLYHDVVESHRAHRDSFEPGGAPAPHCHH